MRYYANRGMSKIVRPAENRVDGEVYAGLGVWRTQRGLWLDIQFFVAGEVFFAVGDKEAQEAMTAIDQKMRESGKEPERGELL